MSDKHPLIDVVMDLFDGVLLDDYGWEHYKVKGKDYDIRFVGSDYADGSYTGSDIDIPVHFINRDHEYSTSKLKRGIFNSLCIETL